MIESQTILQNRYRLHKCLGQNAGRQTWLAGDLKTQKPVVVKLLTFSDRVQWDQVRLFKREAQVLQNLSHPQIPHYLDSFCLDDRLLWFALVQSYIPGRSLKQLLEQGKRYDEAAIRNLAQQLLHILIYLHELSPPVLHRDIKPSNLLLDQTGKLHLVDFGSVQDRAALEGVTFTVVGTYGYVPMEQFGGRAVAASDLYALGATLIHLMTGVAPADLPHPHARIQFADRVSVDPGLVAWVGQLTAPDLADRLSTAAQALDALKHRQHLSLPPTQRQPTGSRIQLKKSSDRLFVKLPSQGWSEECWSNLFYGSVMAVLLWRSTFNVSIKAVIANFWTLPYLLWSVWVILLFSIGIREFFLLFPAFSHTVIVGDRTQFTIYRQLFGIKFWTQRINVSKFIPRNAKVNQDAWELIGSVTQDLPKHVRDWAELHWLVAGGSDYRSRPNIDLFNKAIAEVEQLWLRQEIQDWLDAGQSDRTH